jgi:transposase
LQKLEEVPEEKRVYVDESGCNECYGRTHGRALRGVKVEDTKRGRKYARTNIISAYCCGETLAPKTYTTTTNSAFFENWFEFDFLSVVPCGYTIIMDNARFHRKKVLHKIATRYGVNLLFLPAYSPDFNPIEKFWANLKKWLRKNVARFATLQLAILDYCVQFLF